MNRAELRDAVYDRLGVDSTDPRLTTPRVDRLINDALHLIEIDHEWPWLQASITITTESGIGSYATPADWLRTRYLRIDAFEAMEGYEIGELEDRWPDSTTTGQPLEYSIDEDAVVLRPIPDTTYAVTHRYVKREPSLTNDDQTPLMPDSFHAAIAEVAAFLALRRTREEERAGIAWRGYLEWRERMIDDRRRRKGPYRVKVRPGAWL